MHEYNLDISEKSLWRATTPANSEAMPFHLSEIGKFYAGNDYYTERSENETFLIIYTISGNGLLDSDGVHISFSEGDAAIINCMKHHFYKSDGEWNFFWMHISGSGVKSFEEAINYGNSGAIKIRNKHEIVSKFDELIEQTQKSDIGTLSEISLNIHSILNMLLKSRLYPKDDHSSTSHIEEIRCAVEFIEEHHSEQITIDDILEKIHLSKFYFIRLFKQYMGTTPYKYLISYRINRSKILLRTTNMSIEEIAHCTGFMDSSNFIIQFKKHTHQKPLVYRRDFKI